MQILPEEDMSVSEDEIIELAEDEEEDLDQIEEVDADETKASKSRKRTTTSTARKARPESPPTPAPARIRRTVPIPPKVPVERKRAVAQPRYTEDAQHGAIYISAAEARELGYRTDGTPMKSRYKRPLTLERIARNLAKDTTRAIPVQLRDEDNELFQGKDLFIYKERARHTKRPAAAKQTLVIQNETPVPEPSAPAVSAVDAAFELMMARRRR